MTGIQDSVSPVLATMGLGFVTAFSIALAVTGDSSLLQLVLIQHMQKRKTMVSREIIAFFHKVVICYVK